MKKKYVMGRGMALWGKAMQDALENDRDYYWKTVSPGRKILIRLKKPKGEL
jgi:hypothetical protein